MAAQLITPSCLKIFFFFSWLQICHNVLVFLQYRWSPSFQSSLPISSHLLTCKCWSTPGSSTPYAFPWWSHPGWWLTIPYVLDSKIYIFRPYLFSEFQNHISSYHFAIFTWYLKFSMLKNPYLHFKTCFSSILFPGLVIDNYIFPLV